MPLMPPPRRQSAVRKPVAGASRCATETTRSTPSSPDGIRVSSTRSPARIEPSPTSRSEPPVAPRAVRAASASVSACAASRSRSAAATTTGPLGDEPSGSRRTMCHLAVPSSLAAPNGTTDTAGPAPPRGPTSQATRSAPCRSVWSAAPVLTGRKLSDPSPSHDSSEPVSRASSRTCVHALRRSSTWYAARVVDAETSPAVPPAVETRSLTTSATVCPTYERPTRVVESAAVAARPSTRSPHGARSTALIVPARTVSRSSP